MILSALQRIGKDDYLVAQAAQNPAAFLGLVGKILPIQVSGFRVERRLLSRPAFRILTMLRFKDILLDHGWGRPT